MLTAIEAAWGVSLSPAEGAPRQVTAEVDALLTRAFTASQGENQSPVEVLKAILSSEPRQRPTAYLDEASRDFEKGVAALVEELQIQVTALVEEQRRLFANQEEEFYQIWTEQWAHSLRMLERSAVESLTGVAETYERQGTVILEQLEQDVKLAATTAQRLAEVQYSSHNFEIVSSQLRGAVAEAYELRLESSKLLATAQAERDWHQSEARAVRAQAQGLLDRVTWMQRLQVGIATGAVCTGFMAACLLGLAWPEWLTPVNAVLVMLAFLAVIVITWSIVQLAWYLVDRGSRTL